MSESGALIADDPFKRFNAFVDGGWLSALTEAESKCWMVFHRHAYEGICDVDAETLREALEHKDNKNVRRARLQLIALKLIEQVDPNDDTKWRMLTPGRAPEYVRRRPLGRNAPQLETSKTGAQCAPASDRWGALRPKVGAQCAPVAGAQCAPLNKEQLNTNSTKRPAAQVSPQQLLITGGVEVKNSLPNAGEIVAAWARAWKSKYGTACDVLPADAGAAKRLLSICADVTRVERAMSAYLASHDSRGHTLAFLVAGWNRWRDGVDTVKPQRMATRPGEYPQPQKHRRAEANEQISVPRQ